MVNTGMKRVALFIRDLGPNNVRGIARCSACRKQWSVTTDEDVEETLLLHFADGHQPAASGAELQIGVVGNRIEEYFVVQPCRKVAAA